MLVIRYNVSKFSIIYEQFITGSIMLGGITMYSERKIKPSLLSKYILERNKYKALTILEIE